MDTVHRLLAENSSYAGYIASCLSSIFAQLIFCMVAYKNLTESASDDRELHRVADYLANYACNELNSMDNITVVIIMLAHRPDSKGSVKTRHTYGAATAEAAPEISSSMHQEYSRSRSSRSPSPLPPSNVVAPTLSSASGGSMADDDLMDFLMDDSNF